MPPKKNTPAEEPKRGVAKRVAKAIARKVAPKPIKGVRRDMGGYGRSDGGQSGNRNKGI